MKPTLWKLLSVAAVAMLVAMPTHAQPFFHSKMSIEGMVLNADVVVVGKIVGVAEEKEFYQLTIAVEETLRGEHRERRAVRIERSRWHNGVATYSKADLTKLQEDSHRLLIATEESPQTVCGLIDLADNKLEVWRADLTVLRKPDDVLRVVRETIRRAPGVKRIDTFMLTVPIEGGYYGWGGDTRVEVPTDERLEKKAQEFLGSKARWQRVEGLRAIQHFKSDDNIARVKPLLSDPEWTEIEEKRGFEVRHYWVRDVAYKTLKYWGVNVETPIIREEVKKVQRPKP